MADTDRLEDEFAELHAIKAEQSAQGREIGEIKADISGIRQALTTLADKISSTQRTRWPTIWSGIAVAVAVIALGINGWVRDLGRIEIEVQSLRSDDRVAAYDHGRRDALIEQLGRTDLHTEGWVRRLAEKVETNHDWMNAADGPVRKIEALSSDVTMLREERARIDEHLRLLEAARRSKP